MPRPANKTDLIRSADEQYQKLGNLIDSMTETEQNAAFLFEDRDRNIRDVLVHLYEWHQLLLNWADTNRTGISKPFLPEPYNWKTYGEMNVEMIWKKHQNTSYADALKMFQESHRMAMALIRSFTDEELFVKGFFSWTGTTNLGSYCISATSSHYDWAMKKIKKQIKVLCTKGLKEK